MTAAEMVAEALAHAVANTPDEPTKDSAQERALHVERAPSFGRALGRVSIFGFFDMSNPLEDRANYLRRDVVDAALAHLAERASRAEERAARAEAERDRLTRLGWAMLTSNLAAWKFVKSYGLVDELEQCSDENEAAAKDAEIVRLRGEIDTLKRFHDAAMKEDAEKEAPRG